MVLFNYSTRELTAKIVYYGPGLCGKTTNLQYIHANLPDQIRGKMLSLATKTDRTLFFDFLPVDLGEIRGMRTRVQLYTVPGQVFYNETRKLVLKGADGIVFVADSQEQMVGANVESFRNLEENLKAHGLKLAEMPHILQFNKRDLPKLTSIEDLNAGLNRYNAPFYESVATSGIGVQDTLKAIFKLVLLQLTRKYDPKAKPAAAGSSPARIEETPRSAPPARGTPVVPFEAPSFHPAAIPLAAIEEPATSRKRVAASSDFGHGASIEEPATGDVPAFDSNEIEDLVSDVEESYPVAASAEATFAAASVVSAPSRRETVSFDAPATPEAPRSRGSKKKERGSSKSASRGAAAPPPPAPEAQFEVDRGFDPEWQPESSVRPEELLGHMDMDPGEREIETSGDLPPVARPAASARIAEGAPQDVAPHSARASEEEPLRVDTPVLLTELAQDRHLFEDPSLEIARLAAGDRREIVIPVEFTEGMGVRRFKLSIQLRFDPLD